MTCLMAVCLDYLNLGLESKVLAACQDLGGEPVGFNCMRGAMCVDWESIR